MSKSTAINLSSREQSRFTAISLYSGAGGLDLGLKRAGIDAVLANDIDPSAVDTYSMHSGTDVASAGDVRSPEIRSRIGDFIGEDIDIVAGGPPCQGFSVSGRMDPNDPRSRHVFDFFEIVRAVQPRAFIMENVKALAVSRRWHVLRNRLFQEAIELGYRTQLILLNASHFDVPQARERMFLLGVRDGPPVTIAPTTKFDPPSVRSALAGLPDFGQPGNDTFCTARVTPAKNPVMRRSPYAGMLFNGQGRPLDVDRPAMTLPASMGGNRTPIIDQEHLTHGGESWVLKYHRHLRVGGRPVDAVPHYLRRLTVEEAAALQTFPMGMRWAGRQTAQYRQIGNAVPPELAYRVGIGLIDALRGKSSNEHDSSELWSSHAGGPSPGSADAA